MKLSHLFQRLVCLSLLLASVSLFLVVPAHAQRKPLKVVSPATRQLLLQGKYAEALTELNQRLLVDSLNADLLGMRAECLFNLPGEVRAKAALTDLNKALRTLPNNPILRGDRGHVYFVLHRFPEAISELNFALPQMPNDAPFLAQRGYCHLSVNHIPEALADITRATSLVHYEPDYGLMLGFIQMVSGRLDLALKTFDKVVAKHNSFGLGYAFRATVRQQLNDLPGARQDIAKALQISPSDSTTRLLSAFVCEQAGEKENANNLYNEVLSQAKSKAQFYFERGDLYLQIGQIIAAEDDWKKAAALGNAEAETRLAAHYQPHPK